MAEPEVYLQKLSAFSRILRLEGLSVSPKETEDASRLLIAIGLDDRKTVKTALRTVYAKSREEQISFDRAFDGFFISEEAMRRQAKEQMEREKELQQHRQEAEEELQLNGKPMDLDEQQRETYAAMPEEARQRLRNFMDKYRGTAERNPQLYGDFIHSVFARTLMEQQMLLENAGLGVRDCTFTTRQAYTTYRRQVPWHRWCCWIPSPGRRSATCAPPPVARPPRSPGGWAARASSCATRFTPSGRKFSPETSNAWRYPMRW